MEKSLGQFGAISGSTTFPTQCTVELQDSASVYTETRLLLTTFDVDGKRRNSGGDPVKAEIRRGKVSAEQICDPAVESINAVIKDNENGTYSILFRLCFFNDTGRFLVWRQIGNKEVCGMGADSLLRTSCVFQFFFTCTLTALEVGGK